MEKERLWDSLSYDQPVYLLQTATVLNLTDAHVICAPPPRLAAPTGAVAVDDAGRGRKAERE